MTDIYLQITTFAFILMRMTGMIITNPLLGRSNFPRMYKAGMILAFSVLIFTYTDVYVEPIDTFIEYVLLLMKEFIAGFTMGMIVNFFAYIIVFAGEQMDMQLGISMSAMYDPGSHISMSSSGTFYNVMFILMFFSTNSHITMIRLFLDSQNIIPYGQVVINTQLSNTMLDLFCQCTVLGVKMALPIVAMELMVEIAVGIMMKAVPQIDVFIVNIQLKLLLGVVFMFLLLSPMADFVGTVITSMFDAMQNVLIVMGGQ